MTSNGEMRAVGVDGVAGEVEIPLAIPCFILCAMCPKMRDLASIEDVLLSFVHNSSFLWNWMRADTPRPGSVFASGKTGSGEVGELTDYKVRTTIGGNRSLNEERNRGRRLRSLLCLNGNRRDGHPRV